MHTPFWPFGSRTITVHDLPTLSRRCTAVESSVIDMRLTLKTDAPRPSVASQRRHSLGHKGPWLLSSAPMLTDGSLSKTASKQWSLVYTRVWLKKSSKVSHPHKRGTAIFGCPKNSRPPRPPCVIEDSPPMGPKLITCPLQPSWSPLGSASATHVDPPGSCRHRQRISTMAMQHVSLLQKRWVTTATHRTPRVLRVRSWSSRARSSSNSS